MSPSNAITRYLGSLFAALIAILFVIGALVWHTGKQFVSDSDWVAHTIEVKGQTESILACLGSLRGSAFAYAMTGSLQYLADFQAETPRLEDGLSKLAGLTSDNPDQSGRVHKFTDLVTARRDALAALVASRTISGRPPQTSLEPPREIYQLGSEILAAEDKLLVARRLDVHDSAMTTSVLTAIAVLLSTACLVIAFWMVFNDQRSLNRGRLALEKSHAQLQSALLQSEQLSESLQQLAHFSELLQACRSVDELREAVRVALAKLLPDLGGRLAFMNPSQNLMAIGAHWGPHGLIAESVFSPEDCWAIRRGQPYPPSGGASGISCKHIHYPNPDSPHAGYLCIPLAAQGKVLGLLTMDSNEPPTESQRRVVLAIGEQLGLAIANMQLQETLRTQSIRDPLTSLFNRRYLEVSLEREIQRATRRSQPLAALMVDIDHFKQFNDTYGHEAGDVLLSQFAEVLRLATRSEDVVCRYGGEEFTIVLPEADEEAAVRRADQVRQAVQAMRVTYRQSPLPSVTVSIGVALFPRDGQSPADLLRRADAALYDAKQNGRNRVVVAQDNV